MKPWWRVALFRGMVNDVKRRAPYYWSDFADAWDYRVVPSTGGIPPSSLKEGVYMCFWKIALTLGDSLHVFCKVGRKKSTYFLTIPNNPMPLRVDADALVPLPVDS